MIHARGGESKGGLIMAKREMKTQNVEETIIEPVIEETIVEQSEPIVEVKKEDKEGGIEKGTVVGCTTLNIRKAPASDATVKTRVNAGETLTIVDRHKSKGKWYKVITSNKIEGFCMKDYVKIN
mgnify:CR=1 FL=1